MQQQIQEDVKKAQDELAVTDKEIKTLKPQMKLDTLRERSKEIILFTIIVTFNT